MQRIVTLDTETTGLDWKRGDRVIEIGAVEIVGRQLTGRHFHEFLNPEREIDAGAIAVMGLPPSSSRTNRSLRKLRPLYSTFCAMRWW
jgi:DNA polymerase-3 subunit epsilon